MDVWHYAHIKQQPCRKTVNSRTLVHPETRNAHHIISSPGHATSNSVPLDAGLPALADRRDQPSPPKKKLCAKLWEL